MHALLHDAHVYIKLVSKPRHMQLILFDANDLLLTTCFPFPSPTVAPMVHVENQLLGAPLHTNVAIECHVEAFPHAITYWQRDTSEMLLQG